MDKKIKQPVGGNKVAKVPVVMQMEALECGAAALAMVLAYYDRWVPLEQVRSDCGVSRDGSNAKSILKAARIYGLDANGYKLEPEDVRAEGLFPSIIHWNFNHFVVLRGFKRNKAYLNDPARGVVSVPMEEFDRSFTGICLEFEPSESFKPGGQPASVIDFTRKRMRGTAAAVAFVVLTSVITSLIGIVQSGFSRVFLDQLLTGKNPDWLAPFTLGMIVLAIIQVALGWMNAVYSLRINGKMDAVGNTEFLWKVLHLPLEFFSQRMAGDIRQRMATNASIASTLVNTSAPLLINTVMMVFYLVVMVRYSLLLTMVGVASIVVNLCVSNLISARRVNLTRVISRDSGKLASATVSGIEMIETIKASGSENGYFERWAGYQASVNTQQVRYARLNQYLGLVPVAVSQLTNAAVLLLGVLLVMRGKFTAGMIYAFQGFLSSFIGPAMSLIGAGQTIQEMRTNMERVEDVMEYPDDVTYRPTEEATKAEGQSFAKLGGRVQMHGVSFGYSKLAQPLIKDFELDVAPGSCVAFVGPSGCGKSTLSNLISGMYQPWEGEILFDGKPMSAIDRAVFTSSLAVVDQDIILFEDTIANNIKMWDESIEDFEMIMAARDAQLHKDIMQREGGYQYKLTEGGKDLSGGQRQRLDIARVLAQDPVIIILDEATSALDAKTEYDVVRAIKERDITCIVIAHRLSTIRNCDEIVVLDRGKVVERGTHDDLMAAGGMYTQLVTSE